MEELKNIKKSRSSGKKTVNRLIRKLKSALQYGGKNTSSLKEELDEEYDKLFELDIQVTELDSDDSNFLDEVSNAYECYTHLS